MICRISTLSEEQTGLATTLVNSVAVRARPRILFVACTPIQDHPGTGVDQRMRVLFDALGQIGDVQFHQANPPLSQPSGAGRPLGSLRDEATEAAVLHPDLRKRRPQPLVSNGFQALDPGHFDVVFLHRLGAAWWVGWTDDRRTILDIDDVPSQIFRDRMRLGTPLKRLPRRLLYHWVRRCERRALDAFRFSLVCSDEDRRYLDHPRVAVVPNCYYAAVNASPPKRTEGAGSMLFVGSLGYPPNPEGLAWFVREVLPKIRESLPDATLTVVGRTPSRGTDHFWWRDRDGVRFVGSVDDVSPYINDARLEICPLLRGQGTRVKIIESLVHGKPVVSTTVGAYGIPASEAQGLFRRDDAEFFARECIRLLRDHVLRASIGERGRQWALENASPASTRRHLESLVDVILTERGYASRAR
jgi:glycosyltransferase involved in cell wall biosynthesis